jgi:malate dehydrogenase (quinone)
MQSPEEKFEALVKYYPEAKFEDWELITAGQRVQIIKKDKEDGGKLQFGTEIVASKDKTLAALLGASPGASTAVSIMLNLLQKCLPEEIISPEWQTKLTEMIPCYGRSLITDGALCQKTREYSTAVLKLKDV